MSENKSGSIFEFFSPTWRVPVFWQELSLDEEESAVILWSSECCARPVRNDSFHRIRGLRRAVREKIHFQAALRCFLDMKYWKIFSLET